MAKWNLRRRYAKSAVDRAMKNLRVAMIFDEEAEALDASRGDLVLSLEHVLERQELALVNMALSNLKDHVEPIPAEEVGGEENG